MRFIFTLWVDAAGHIPGIILTSAGVGIHVGTLWHATASVALLNGWKMSKSTTDWNGIIAPFKQADVRRSIWQVVNTSVPFVAMWYVMYLSLSVGYWLTLLLAFVAAGLLVRMFIILHDCTHGSFLPTQRGNTILGSILGVVCVTPFAQWRHSHAVHHATSGDLTRRIPGELLPFTIAKCTSHVGDVLTLTVNEYRQLRGWERAIYRVYRHPIFLLGIVPSLLFIVLHRFPERGMPARVRNNVWLTNLAIFAVLGSLSWLIGWQAVLMIQLPITVIAATIGVWLFYVQHQFEDTYWADHGEWSYETAALQGSSLYRLPRVLQWFTGNIGFHHIHHLSPRIPNYQLEACHKANPLFAQAHVLTLRESLTTLRLRLWDEEARKLVGWRAVRRTT